MLETEFDVREMASYGIVEAANYLSLPVSTLRSWVLGGNYQTTAGRKIFTPVIDIADKAGRSLSFLNLVEIHVLMAIRRHHTVPLPRVRKALDYLQREFESSHPLAREQFETDGMNLFVSRFGQLINISEEGQLAMRDVLRAHLARIERDADGFPVRLYPFTRWRSLAEPKLIAIDPGVSFGKPVIAGTRIPTASVAERYKSGESIGEIARRFGRSTVEVEEAIRCELRVDAA
jgi:uncharacterized protein (DUF433 family)